MNFIVGGIFGFLRTIILMLAVAISINDHSSIAPIFLFPAYITLGNIERIIESYLRNKT